MKKLLTALAIATAAIFVSVPPAFAIPPTHEPVSFPDRTFSGQCPFDVHREVLVNRSVLTTFANGNQLTTGTFKERLTNLSTGEFIDVNASGPILTVFHQDGSSTEYLRGRQFVRPFDQLLITTGRVIVERDPAGVIVGFTQLGGTSQDVCELLA
jgi:hypothetical protein